MYKILKNFIDINKYCLQRLSLPTSNIDSGTNFYLENTIENPLKINLKASESVQGENPSPSNPQEIHTVKGDNEIVIINKNLFDKNNANIINCAVNALPIQMSANAKSIYIKIIGGKTYTISKIASTRLRAETTIQTPAVGVSVSDYQENDSGTSLTIQTSASAKYLLVYYYLSGTDTLTEQQILDSMQIEEGTTPTPYIEHQEQNYPINLGVENLFENVVYKNNYFIGSNGGEVSNDSACIWKKIKVKPNTTYTLSYESNDYTFGQRIAEYNTSDVFIQRNITYLSSYTFTTSNTTEYINISGLKTDGNIQIEEGTVAHSYSPYGQTPIELCKIGDYQDLIFKNTLESEYYDSTLELNKWYKLDKIGKVVLDGSEDWSTPNNISYSVAKSIISNVNIPGGNLTNYLVNSFIIVKNLESSFVGSCWSGTSYINFNYDGTNSNLNDFKEWLSTHNLIVYYVLATPTNTLLSDTLQTELNDLEENAKTYHGITNINQVNSDNSFILDIEYITQNLEV